MPGLTAWSKEEAIAVMDQLGVRTAMLSISSPGVHFGDEAAARSLAWHVSEAGAELATEGHQIWRVRHHPASGHRRRHR